MVHDYHVHHYLDDAPGQWVGHVHDGCVRGCSVHRSVTADLQWHLHPRPAGDPVRRTVRHVVGVGSGQHDDRAADAAIRPELRDIMTLIKHEIDEIDGLPEALAAAAASPALQLETMIATSDPIIMDGANPSHPTAWAQCPEGWQV